MKILLTICFQLLMYSCFAQETFESCFNRYFSSSLRSVISDSIGNFYVTGSCDLPVSYSKPGIFLKLNAQGDILEEKFIDGQLDLFDFQHTPDGNMFVAGSFEGCDIGGCGAIIIKLNNVGDTIWTSSFARSVICNTDYRFRQALSLQNGNFLYKADSTIYFFNSAGDSLWLVIDSRILSVNESFSGEILCGADSGLIILDSNGQQTNSLNMGISVGSIFKLAGSTYLIPYLNQLYKFDLNFALINQLDLSTYNTSASKLKIFKNTIWCFNSILNQFVSFNDQFQFVDSFTVNNVYASVNDFAVNDSAIMMVGRELLVTSNCYLKSVTTTGSTDTFLNDIAFTELIIDTTFVTQPSPLPSGVYQLKSVCRIKVQNNSNDTLRSFYFNTETFLSGYCGNGKIQIYFDSLSILPGQTSYLQIDTLYEWGMVISQFPFALDLCGWISCPNSKPDINHADNALCDTAIFYGQVGVNEFVYSDNLILYPNPFADKLNIEIKKSNFKNAMIRISDLAGKIILTRAVYNSNEQFDFSDFSSGVYFVNVIVDGEQYILKMVK